MVPGILGPANYGCGPQFVACMWLHLCGSMYLGPCGSRRGPLILGCGPSVCGVYVAPLALLLPPAACGGGPNCVPIFIHEWRNKAACSANVLLPNKAIIHHSQTNMDRHYCSEQQSHHNHQHRHNCTIGKSKSTHQPL